ncbi:MAG: 16S rRNA (cytosine(967)-C(5))-methyltransferase [Cyanobacteriota bacterium]
MKAPQHPITTETDGLAPRRLAWKVLEAVAAGAFADNALERELAKTNLAPLDRGLATELAYGAIRQRFLLDAWIDAHGRLKANRQPPRLRWLLHVGLYQLLFSSRVPASAAVNTSVQLAKEAGFAQLAPVVNGLLRAVARAHNPHGAEADTPRPLHPWQGLALPDAAAASLALRHSLPPWLATQLLQWCRPEEAEAFGNSSNTPPALDLRINRRRSGRAEVLAAFGAAGLTARALDDQEWGLCLAAASGDLRGLPGFKEGHWCVQDRTAQAIAPLLAPQPGQRVLDACAAPGGKSTQLAELMDDQGEIWAVDRSEARLKKVVANAERLGMVSLQVLAADAADLLEIRPQWRGYFDRILVDAPCSGLGTLARHADARWRIQPDTIAELASQQQRLLERLAPLLQPTGRLVYATCTVHPQENGDVVAAFLACQPSWQLIHQQQWWPSAQAGDGFYAAVLEPRHPDQLGQGLEPT